MSDRERLEASHEPEAGKLFLEPADLDGALRICIRIDEILYARRTRYQMLHVARCGALGKVLILDGCIQITEFDLPAYHEMLVHVPMLSHPAPRRVLVIGGGDGATLREVLRHPEVEQVEVAEIDGEVIEAARRFFPDVAAAYDDGRVKLHIADGAKFIQGREQEYDVILVDSSDPEGPAGVLYTEQFYAGLKRALRPGGIAATQAECFYLYPELLRHLFSFIPGLFKVGLYYLAMVPTYTSGLIGFSFCSLGPLPTDGPDPQRLAALGQLKYYTPQLHRAAFALPKGCLELLPPEVAAAQSRMC